MAHIVVNSIQNDDIKPYYQIEQLYDDGSTEVVEKWNPDGVFDVKLGQNRQYKIKVRASSLIDNYGEAYQLYEM